MLLTDEQGGGVTIDKETGLIDLGRGSFCRGAVFRPKHPTGESYGGHFPHMLSGPTHTPEKVSP